jgi:hypothetical protein
MAPGKGAGHFAIKPALKECATALGTAISDAMRDVFDGLVA